MSQSVHWQRKVGNQRDWVWRGWQTRYTYIRPKNQVENDGVKSLPLILLHGFGASIGHWRHNLGVLSERHTVYALDMLGFGASEKAAANYSVHLWVEQIHDFWKAFIRKPVILVGNSIGSLISLAAAAKYPEMVQGLVMISLPDPDIEKEAIPPFLFPLVEKIKSLVANPLLIKPIFYLLRQPSILRRGVSLGYVNPKAVTNELVDIFAQPPQDRGSARAFIALVKSRNKQDYSPNVKKLLSIVKIPILLIWGEKDRIIPPVLAAKFASYNENLQLINLENLGHFPHDECPETVNQLILDWIEQQSSGKS